MDVKETRLDISDAKITQLEYDAKLLPEYKSAYPYRASTALFLLKLLLVICTGGVFGLILLWNYKTNFWFEWRCNIQDADKFLICSLNDNWVSANVYDHNGIKYYEYNGLRYIYNGQYFILPPPISQSWTHGKLLEMASGLSSNSIGDEIMAREGKNIIDVPPINLFEDIAQELLKPDYIYIYLCCALWFVHDYATFAAILLGLSIIGGVWEVWNRRTNRDHIRNMAKYIIDVQVLRNGEWRHITSDNLLPGDVVELPGGGWKAPCDFVLVSGSAIVDESSLTGESLPVVKISPGEQPNKLYDSDKDKKYTIYGGTTVVGSIGTGGKKSSAKVKPRLLVVRTGWKSAKGNLIRSILNVKTHEYVYEIEARIFLIILIFIGIGLFFVSLYFFGSFQPGVPFDPENLLFGFEAIAILVPPMLPTLFQIGLVMSASILQNEYKVFTTDSSRIPLSGKIDIMCFDKTGTLTKDDLDMIGGIYTTNKGFTEITEVPSINNRDLIRGMACCHQLGEINSDLFHEQPSESAKSIFFPKKVRYSGPIVDIKIFESTGWTYHDGDGESVLPHSISKSGEKIDILKRFDFDPTFQRMSVITSDDQHNMTVFCKGSPEMIKEVCDPSTLPVNYLTEVKKHSRNGCYVLAIAFQPKVDLHKNIPDIERVDVEHDLIFLGFILLRNELKPDTTEAIHQLKHGRVKMMIITGDNIYTAFYIGKKCGIVSAKRHCFIGNVENGVLTFHDAYNSKRKLDVTHWTVTDKKGNVTQFTNKEIAIGITSDAWEYLINKDEKDFLIKEVKIFARMKPLQKEAVVKMISASNHIVGMCGDGANDCAALSAAHCGVALSEAEASVVSPFTAKLLTIQSVVDLVREGRACLANSFANFKFTLIYGITQTTQALFCYYFGADLSEFQYILIDFIFFVPSAFFITKSQSSHRLVANPPTSKVFGPRTLSSLFGIFVIMLLSLFAGSIALHNQSWLSPIPENVPRDDNGVLHEIPQVTTTWFIGAFVYPAAAIASTIGGRWRKPFFFNVGLMFSVACNLCIANVLIWMFPEWDAGGSYKFLELVFLPLSFRVDMFLIGISAFFLIIFWEFVIVNKIGDSMGEKYQIGRGPVDEELPINGSEGVGLIGDSSDEEEPYLKAKFSE